MRSLNLRRWEGGSSYLALCSVAVTCVHVSSWDHNVEKMTSALDVRSAFVICASSRRVAVSIGTESRFVIRRIA